MYARTRTRIKFSLQVARALFFWPLAELPVYSARLCRADSSYWYHCKYYAIWRMFSSCLFYTFCHMSRIKHRTGGRYLEMSSVRLVTVAVCVCVCVCV